MNQFSPYDKNLLEEHRPYYVYRALLYLDGLTARTPVDPHGSVDVVYFIHLGLPLHMLCALCEIRTLSLSPAGASSHLVLDHNIGDLTFAGPKGAPSN